MGGNALKPLGIEVRRYKTDELSVIEHEVLTRMEKLGFIAWCPNNIKNKETHGDLDVFYTTDRDDLNFIKLWGLKSGEYVKNSNMIHTCLNGDLQVDFIKIPHHRWEFTKLYYNNGDMGNIIGKMCYNLSLSFTHHGLYYVYRPSENVKRKILITDDPKKSCEILQLDYDKIQSGFDSNEDLFNFIYECNLVNTDAFKLENLNGNDRIRNRKRKQYGEMIDFFSNLPPKTNVCRRPSLDEMLAIIDSDGKFCIKTLLEEQMTIIDGKEEERKKRAENRKKIVEQLMEQGFRGKELGKEVQRQLQNK